MFDWNTEWGLKKTWTNLILLWISLLSSSDHAQCGCVSERHRENIRLLPLDITEQLNGPSLKGFDRTFVQANTTSNSLPPFHSQSLSHDAKIHNCQISQLVYFYKNVLHPEMIHIRYWGEVTVFASLGLASLGPAKNVFSGNLKCLTHMLFVFSFMHSF